jgi:hypothetical protein
MRRVAHELASLEEASSEFRDGLIFRVLRENLEFVIADVSHSNWTVARSQRDLRGQTRGRRNSHQRIRIDPSVRRALCERLSTLSGRTVAEDVV